MRKTLLASSLLTMFVVGAQGSSIIYPMGQPSTASFGQGGADGPVARGWDFRVNDPIVLVEQLGVNAATSIPMTLTLWDITVQTKLAQVFVTSSARTWVFGNIGSQVPIGAGHDYAVIGWADAGDAWYLVDTAPPAAFEPTGTIEYLRARFNNGNGPDTFPLGTAAGQYGVTDIGYAGPSVAPEPSGLLLAGAGTLLLLIRRRRTRG